MSKHIVIVGGGVIGLCTAYYCARKGHRVTVLDRVAETHEGCSYGNAGLVVPSHFIPLAAPGVVGQALKWMWNPESPFYVKPRLDFELFSWGWKFMQAATAAHVERSAPLLRDLNYASLALFEELTTLPGEDFGLTKKGLLMLCRTQAMLDKESKFAERARQLGVPAQMLDAKQTAALEPTVPMNIAGAVLFPKDCHLTPGRFMATLKQECARLKVKLCWNTEVTGWRVKAGRIDAITAGAQDFAAEEFVLGGGSWSPLVARELELRIPMQAGKGYSFTLPQPRQLPQLCHILTEARIAATPMSGALRFGGTMEIAGLNEEINPARVRGIISAVPQYYPEFTAADFKAVKPWAGLRPVSPDGLPYVGRTTKYTNLSIATGHAMMGLSLGPITGQLMARVVSGEKPEIDLAPLSPDRYA
jgi:D-amino-acid dehydrogenase